MTTVAIDKSGNVAVDSRVTFRGQVQSDSAVKFVGMRLPSIDNPATIVDATAVVVGSMGSLEVLRNYTFDEAKQRLHQTLIHNLWSSLAYQVDINTTLIIKEKGGALYEVVFDHESPSHKAIVYRIGPSDPIRLPYALGSGRKYALGAMEAGADAWQAVSVSIKLDTHTGGTVNTVTFD